VKSATHTQQFLPRGMLQTLLDTLIGAGYQCVGPVVKNDAIVFDKLKYSSQLPQGWQDTQQPGQFNLHHTGSQRVFAWSNGAQAIKPYVFPPREVLWQARRNEDGKLVFEAHTGEVPRIAIIGGRACDLAALKLMDAHFMSAEYPDAQYQARRDNLLIIGVNCSHPSANCFCASTGDGPRLQQGYDIALDELEEGFLLQDGSDTGAAIMSQLSLQSASAEQIEQAAQQVQHARDAQQKCLPSGDIRMGLLDNLEHGQWDDVAKRCLSCGNCTMVCPTCFCHAHIEDPKLDGSVSTHYRQWDSCFTQGHSYIHGITIRGNTRARYRQWLTHKFARWHDQFGRSGCVGCGRCISWCPVGIDVTAELAAIVPEVEDVSG